MTENYYIKYLSICFHLSQSSNQDLKSRVLVFLHQMNLELYCLNRWPERTRDKTSRQAICRSRSDNKHKKKKKKGKNVWVTKPESFPHVKTVFGMAYLIILYNLTYYSYDTICIIWCTFRPPIPADTRILRSFSCPRKQVQTLSKKIGWKDRPHGSVCLGNVLTVRKSKCCDELEKNG